MGNPSFRSNREISADTDPGFKYSPLTRIELVLPIAVAYLAAAGAAFLSRGRFRTAIAVLFAVASATDLAVFAGRFYPYIEPRLASSCQRSRTRRSSHP